MKTSRDIAILGYFHGPKLGVGVFMDRFITTLAKDPAEAGRIVYYTNQNTLTKITDSLNGIEVRTPWMLGAGSVAAIFWSAVVFPVVCLLRGMKANLILANPIVMLPLVPTVSVICDVSEFEIKSKYGGIRSFYRKHLMLASSIRFSRRIVVISRFVREQLARYFDTAARRPVQVVPLGVDVAALTENDLSQYGLCPEGFYLVVGRIDPRGKNLYAVLDLYRRLEDLNPGRKLIFVGGLNKSTQPEAEEFLEFVRTDPWFSTRVRYLGYIDNQTLSSLYSTAAATILYSRVEGFGFPMIEAFKLGCPVIINPACEVLHDHSEGAAIEIAETQLTTGLPDAIDQLFDPEARHQLKQRMSEVAAKYTWEACVRGYLEVLNEVVR